MACYSDRLVHRECSPCVNSSCVCADGWTAETDLLLMDLRPWGGAVLDCPLFEAALTVLWVIPVPLAVVAIAEL